MWQLICTKCHIRPPTTCTHIYPGEYGCSVLTKDSNAVVKDFNAVGLKTANPSPHSSRHVPFFPTCTNHTIIAVPGNRKHKTWQQTTIIVSIYLFIFRFCALSMKPLNLPSGTNLLGKTVALHTVCHWAVSSWPSLCAPEYPNEYGCLFSGESTHYFCLF